MGRRHPNVGGIMVRTVGVIVEYNPFHNGHLYHLRQAVNVTSADAVVAVMSGNFLQRGEPALIDKWTRAEMALRGGADLVIELPAVYASQPAEWFAFGAVSILEATGIVDALCFGSESGDLSRLKTAAQTLISESDAFREELHHHLKKGWSYPRAYGHTLQQFNPHLPVEFAQPNNMLGLHYLAALTRLNSRIEPFTIRRKKAAYHETRPAEGNIASATAIRKIWLETNNLQAIQPYVPVTTFRLLDAYTAKGIPPLTWESFHQALMAKLLSVTTTELKAFYGIDEGLEYRLHRQLAHAETIHAYLSAVKTKRYTWNRLQRALVSILLGWRKADVNPSQLTKGPAYLRILGFSDRGRLLLQQMKETASLPTLTRIQRERPSMLDGDIRAAQMYNLATGWQLPYKEEFTRTPVYVSSSEANGNLSK